MTDMELDMIIDWCRKKIECEKHHMNTKKFEGYVDAMHAVMSYLHKLKEANNEPRKAD